MVEFYRQVVLRGVPNATGDKVATVRAGARAVTLPVLSTYYSQGWAREVCGFGQLTLAWDGKETNVQGLPVYR